MKVVLFAMTSKGYAVLNAFLESSRGLVAFVVGARDSAIDDDCYEQIEMTCFEHNIPFFARDNHPEIASEHAVLAISWRWIINSVGAPVIVFHDSILPRCRGFNPLVTSLVNGDERIGVTALYATSEYDKGDVIGQSTSPITYPITISRAIEIIQENYAELARSLASFLEKGALPPGVPQSEAHATYSLWRDDSDYHIDWSRSSKEIRRHVDAVGFPYMGASSFMNGELVKILRVSEVLDVVIENRTPGKIIFLVEGLPVVVCGEGLLMIEELVSADTRKSLLPVKKFRTRFS